MRTALDIVRDLVREEQTLAQRLEVVRAQLGALRKLARVETSAPRARPSSSGPARAAAMAGPPPPSRLDVVRQRALERAEQLRAEMGEKLPWKRAKREPSPTGGRGPRVPYSARPGAGAAEYFRCRCAGDAQLGQANNQAQAKLACGALVFGKKLRDHLAEHDIAVASDEAALKYFEPVDARQGAE